MYSKILIKTFLAVSILLLFGCNNPGSPKNSIPTQQSPLVETRWKLIELMGKPVVPGVKEPYIILKAKMNNQSNLSHGTSDGRIIGSGGCNSFSGSYELKEPTKIQFKQIASTMMACVKGMDTERLLLDVLEKTDSYMVNGNSLQLYRARMAPLAKFVAD